MSEASNPFEYVTQKITAYKTDRVPLAENWDWNMWEHIQRTILYKHGKFLKGKQDGSRPFKNIILPIVRVSYRTEGFDVKDITPYVNDDKNYYKSFFVKKFHPYWARDNDLDGFIDEFSESVIDFGLGLAKNVNSKRPEVVPLQRLAFCDQTDIMSGPICELHPYSVDQLLEMKGKWWDEEIDKAIILSQTEKAIIPDGETKAKTPGKYIECYELHGTFPKSWLGGEYTEQTDEYCGQIHIITYYTDDDGKKQGLSLFAGKEKKSIYKAYKRDPIFGRACGYGAVEELFEPQTWTNMSEIQIQELLEAASLVIWQTADASFAGRQKITDLEKNEILVHEAGNPLSQVPVNAYNKAAFDDATARWESHAMTMGSASEGSLAKTPPSGTPFALQSLIVQEGNGMHDYRRGKIAAFVGNKVYPDWVLPALVADMLQGQKWLDELTVEEMKEVVETVVNNLANAKIKALMMEGKIPTDEEMAMFKDITQTQFLKGGNKRFLHILEGELKDIPIDVLVNVAGKQADLAGMSDKLTNIFRQIFANPAILQQPGMGKLFNEIIESAGFSPLDFASFTKPLVQNDQPQVDAPPTPEPSPVALPA